MTMPTLLKNTFEARINKMPIGKPKLTVTGKAEVPTPGWSGSLVRAVPQGINPLVLILDAYLTKPTGIANPVVSKVDLSYEETPPANEYTDVTVRLDGEAVTVKVKIIQ
jgi:hypothetical protein